ncbi:AAA family ATPase [Curtobacterium sp. Csp1]|uniref:AAA family ATPase n=1 Tax=Curtobacterium citreum TaxID=2036 RepID=A0ABT2HGJ8_9MICO|nr:MULTISPECIES: BTAD domain-containing putative transcriptional regulator [Curtobacterium]MCS6522376.1 AAA family ATPase [Curtobacterium citreum]QKS13038.1 AAA family ATPase [Curtobacterium sp. csp3]QKS19264.1 AAA family ATPase [Curtobacterium sp. Csp1]RDI01198.1 putative ATPase [Curtobacterium sp. AG1037]TQJ29505.1 putative ATPase [Curtobacterium citreum]
MPNDCRISVLGPVSVADRSGVPTAVPGALARVFLVALVLARGQTLTTEALIDELWPEERPRGARAALQTLVSRLRRSVADGLVVSTSTGYALGGGDDGDVDLLRAERAAASDDAAAVRAALDAWRGDPGSDVEGTAGEELAERAAAARRALRRRLAGLLLDAGDTAEAAAVWLAETTADPFDEVAVAGCMHALAADGRVTEALAVFAAHRDRLVEELGADPSAELVRLNADLLRRSVPTAGAARRIGLRAAPNALVGREADLAAVTDLLAHHRLVTVLGAGGLGKTRLAQAVAAGLPATTAVVVCELAPLTDADDLLPALAALLGIAEVRSARSIRDAVATDLRSRVVGVLDDGPTVLVLDNCEHLVAGVARQTAELLAAAPSLRVLATSRAPLAVAGEVVAPLAPLPVAEDGAAVRLFTDRARAARPGAVLPVDAVRRICTRLDGSPLAIELAAARVRGMSVEEVERRLDDRFALLRGGDRSAPERHRTLLAVIEWSWRLLDPGAQELLTRLALFPDGVPVDAVQAVAPGGDDLVAFDDLAELVEQSLVQLVETEGEPVRYRLLETVREFGAARLTDRGAIDEVRAAMTSWGRGFSAARNLFATSGPAQLVAFREVRREAENLVTLLRWALRDDDVPTVAHVFAALAGYWTFRGTHGEVVAAAPDVVALLRDRPVASDARAATVVSLVLCGASAAFGDLRTSARAISTLRRLRRTGTTGLPVLDAETDLLLSLGRPAEGTALLVRLREDRDPGVACLAHMLSAPLAENAGEPEAAFRYARRAAELSAVTGDAWTSGSAAVTLTQLHAQGGRYAEALATAEAAREQLERFGADDDLYEISWTVGLASAATGDLHRARTIAEDLRLRPVTLRGGPQDGAAQVGVLALAIDAECARWAGDPDRAAAAYTAAWDLLRDPRTRAVHWRLMAGAARIAAVDEHERARDREHEREQEPERDRGSGGPDRAADANRSDGAATRLPAGERDVARRLRTGALVQLRLRSAWLDMPVVGTAMLGLAIALLRDGRTADAARCWAVATRVGTRQDYAVLAHARVRPLLVAGVGEQALADAETTSSGWGPDEVVVRTRALLEELRVEG